LWYFIGPNEVIRLRKYMLMLILLAPGITNCTFGYRY